MQRSATEAEQEASVKGYGGARSVKGYINGSVNGSFGGYCKVGRGTLSTGCWPV
jgi:hypothetical protein